MAIISYSKNGENFFRVYVQARGKNDCSLRLQRSKKGIQSITEARKEEKKLLISVTEEIAKIEGRGLTWRDIVERWELKAKHGSLGDKYREIDTLAGHLSRLNRYTAPWMKRRASDLTKGDGRQILQSAKIDGAGNSLLKHIKSSINVVYKWAIEEKYVLGSTSSPVEGISVGVKAERIPKILSLEDVRTLLREAKDRDHDWYVIWAFAVLTGMRSSELLALQWKDIDLNKRIINVSKSFKADKNLLKSTKSGYWRSVPISKDLESIILGISNDCSQNPDDFVLPHHFAWKDGQAAQILKTFLKEIGVQNDIVFHTLRACFATHMLASGVDQAKVMKIGGWRDIKTFQIYVRLAGVDVKGATDALDVMPRLMPNNVVNINHFTEG